jgi:hypothetical protein
MHGVQTLGMLEVAFAMQENSVDSGSACGVPVDRVKTGFYSC